MSDDGKVRLSQDLAQYQLVVGHMCSVEKLGRPYKELRAFRTALFAETEQLHDALTKSGDGRGRQDAASIELTTMLHPVVLLHVLAQRAPLDGVAPLHGAKGMVEYCDSLDSSEGRVAAEEHGWAAMEKWGKRAAGDEEYGQLWECAQAWHQRLSSKATAPPA